MKESVKRFAAPLLPLLLSFLFLIYLLNASSVSDALRAALRLCGHALIPSLYPVLVFTRLLPQASHAVRGENAKRKLAKALLFGWTFGYPTGAILMSESLNAQNDKRAAKLLYLSCGTSATFLLSFVGVSLMKDPLLGIGLYGAQILALSLLCVPALCKWQSAPLSPVTVSSSKKTFSDTIRAATVDMLSICGCVLFFASVAALPATYLPKGYMRFLLPWLEIGGAVSHLCSDFDRVASLLLGFSVGFGGLSAIFQMYPFVKQAGGTLKGLIWERLKVGALTALFFFLFTVLSYS